MNLEKIIFIHLEWGVYLLNKFDDIPQKEFCTILSLIRAGKTDEEYREIR